MKKISEQITLIKIFIKQHYKLLILLVILVIAVLLAPIDYTFIDSQGSRYDLSITKAANVPYHQVAIVFGAGIYKDGSPTPYLRYRIETAVKLFDDHRVNKLLMTGDNSLTSYNEPAAMKAYAEKLGVPSKAITLDYAGFNTYDSCFRAKAIFGIKSATLVSQGYHLPRAMVTCRGLGIQNVGVIAEHPSKDYTINYLARELLSTDKMVFQLAFKPNPTALGQPQYIN